MEHFSGDQTHKTLRVQTTLDGAEKVSLPVASMEIDLVVAVLLVLPG